MLGRIPGSTKGVVLVNNTCFMMAWVSRPVQDELVE